MMFKTYIPRIFLMILLSLSAHAHAQWSQTVVDENNRTIPIFFNEPNTQSIHVEKKPSNSVTTQSIGDPLKGPYYLSPERHRILDVAYAALGTPYRYGGNNPSHGLDCSSLMQFIHKKALGKILPRTAAHQRDRSKTIAYQSLQPGDLLFFKINRRTNHVGIYIGHGKFIHASSSKRRAIIDSMEKPYWKKRFVKYGSYLSS